MFLVISSVNFYDEFDNGMTVFGETIFKISNLLITKRKCEIHSLFNKNTLKSDALPCS